MYGPSSHNSLKYEGAELEEFVTPTNQFLPQPPQSPFQTQDSDYIHPITKQDDNLQRALEQQGNELMRLQLYLSKMVKRQRRERAAMMQYIYSLQDQDCEPSSEKTNMLYVAAALFIIVLLIILIILVASKKSKKNDNQVSMETLLTIVRLLKK